MTHEQLSNLFDAWWAESFPMAPCNKQSRERFLDFGAVVINAMDHELTPQPGP